MDTSVEVENNSKVEFAVVIKNVCKSYDKKESPVLNNFCMNVRKGSIYCLLGSSGSGKTTVLSCILGISKWESGEIKVFGENPGTIAKENLVKRIGYVPQEIALYDHLTIKENIQYYGRLYGISEKTIFEQWILLTNLLMLPARSKLVNKLSGGQKRRVSLALSLVHQPELLILDEPTVGLDPLLRDRVWDHLFTLTQNKGISIIITTHYIEESKKSDTIGILRHGSLLVEDSPAKLLAEYNTEFLEDVVLKVIKNSSNSLGARSTLPTNCDTSGGSQIQNNSTNETLNLPHTKNSFFSFHSKRTFDLKTGKVSKTHSQGSYNPSTFDSNDNRWMNTSNSLLKGRNTKDPTNMYKNVFSFWRKTLATSVVIILSLIRHPIFFMGNLILPAYQVLIAFACMGVDPKGLSIVVVNEETPDWQTKCFVDVPFTHNMDDRTFTQFSCWYFQHLGSHDVIKMVPSNSTNEATKGVQKGDFHGYIHFPANFSQHSVDRFTAKQFATEESINGSTIGIRLDMSEFIGCYMIIKHLGEQLQVYFNHLGNFLNVSASHVELPLVFRTPVYGSESNGYYDHYVPAGFANIIFFIPLCCGELLLIGELKIGSYRRAQVAGRTIGEVVTAHVVSQVLMILAQVVICTLCMRFIYNYYIHGSPILYAFLALVIGICGTTIGSLVAVVTQDELEGLMVTVFLCMTVIISGGVIWPLACAQPLWRYFGYALPITLIIDSFRSVIVRGLGITHELVWPGVAYASGWIVVVWVLVVVLSKKLIK